MNSFQKDINSSNLNNNNANDTYITEKKDIKTVNNINLNNINNKILCSSFISIFGSISKSLILFN